MTKNKNLLGKIKKTTQGLKDPDFWFGVIVGTACNIAGSYIYDYLKKRKEKNSL